MTVRAVRSLIFVGLSIFSLSACSTMTPVSPAASTINHVVEKNFTLGAAKTSYVGEPMIKVKDYFQTMTRQNSWTISDAIKVELSLGYIVLVPGTYPVAGREQVDNTWYDVVNVNAHPLELLTMSQSATVAPFVLLIGDDGRIARLQAGFGSSNAVSTVPIDYRAIRSVDTKVDTQKGYTNFELIYTGMSGGVLRITYREYSPDDLARTAFFQDLTYNSDQKQIRFRDISLEVAAATNESIKFKVVTVPDNFSGNESR